MKKNTATGQLTGGSLKLLLLTENRLVLAHLIQVGVRKPSSVLCGGRRGRKTLNNADYPTRAESFGLI